MKRKGIASLQDDEVELFDGMMGMIEGLDDKRKTELLQTFILLLGCVDAENGRLDNSKLTRLVEKLSDGKFSFQP